MLRNQRFLAHVLRFRLFQKQSQPRKPVSLSLWVKKSRERLCMQTTCFITPRKINMELTWNVQKKHLKGKIIFQTSIFGFQPLIFQGAIRWIQPIFSAEKVVFFWGGGEDINMYLHCFYISFYIFFVINRFCETYLGCKLSRWIGGITQSIAGASTDLDFVD